MEPNRVTKVYSGQGDAFVGPVGGYVAADAEGFEWLGNTPEISITFNITTTEIKESRTGHRSTMKSIITGREADLAIAMNHWHPTSLGLLLQGGRVDSVAGSVSDLSIGDPPVGKLIPLEYDGLDAVVIKDSTGTPKVLPESQYYVDAANGGIVILDKTTGGPYVAPFKLNFDHEARARVPILTTVYPEKQFRFHGVNSAEADGAGGFEGAKLVLYKVRILPDQAMPLIQDDFARFALKAKALIDLTRADDDELGQFGFLTMPLPAADVI